MEIAQNISRQHFLVKSLSSEQHQTDGDIDHTATTIHSTGVPGASVTGKQSDGHTEPRDEREPDCDPRHAPEPKTALAPARERERETATMTEHHPVHTLASLSPCPTRAPLRHTHRAMCIDRSRQTTMV